MSMPYSLKRNILTNTKVVGFIITDSKGDVKLGV